MYCTVPYSILQYSPVQYRTVQYSTVQYSIVQYNAVQYRALQYSTVQGMIIYHLNLPTHRNIYHLSYAIQTFQISSQINVLCHLFFTIIGGR